MVADFALCEKKNWVGHLKTIFALGGRNLKRPIIVSMLEGFPAKARWHNISAWPCEGAKLFCFVVDVDHPQLLHKAV